VSVTVKIRSKREISAGSRSICSLIGSYWSNRPYLGLAAPSSEQRDLRVALIPAFETEIFCCSRASWHGTPVFRSHFVQLVDGGDSPIREDERAGLEAPLLAVAEVVANGCGGEPR